MSPSCCRAGQFTCCRFLLDAGLFSKTSKPSLGLGLWMPLTSRACICRPYPEHPSQSTLFGPALTLHGADAQTHQPVPAREIWPLHALAKTLYSKSPGGARRQKPSPKSCGAHSAGPLGPPCPHGEQRNDSTDGHSRHHLTRKVSQRTCPNCEGQEGVDR